MKKKAIKIISLTLALIMCLGVLCSCSTNSKVYAKSEGGNKISVAMYSLITSLMKGNDAYYIRQEYGDYNSAKYWNQIVDPDTQMTMKEYYQYMIDLKIKNYLAALDLFDELAKDNPELKLTDAEIAAIDAEMDAFVEQDGNGSKNVLNKEILANFGANYDTLREYKIMNAKINKLSTFLYGSDASEVSSTIKQDYFNKHYVAFKMILIPTYSYAYVTDKYENDVYYEVDDNGAFKTAKDSAGKTHNVIAYDKENGIILDKNDVDDLGHTVYHTYANLTIAYDKENGQTADADGDGNKDKDIYGNFVYYSDVAAKKIAYDTKNGGFIDLDGDDEDEKDANGDVIRYNYDVAIAYDKENGKRIELLDEKGNKVTRDFTKDEKAKAEQHASEVYKLVEAQKYANFELLISEYDQNYGVETEAEKGSLIYLSENESYTAGSNMMNDMYGKISKIKVGESLLYTSDYGYHIIMRYELEAGAYEKGAYKPYFESFTTNLINELFFKRIEPYTANITFKEKYKDDVDISAIAPNYNFY